MSIFSYHLVEVHFLVALKGMVSNPISTATKGLIHSKFMSVMTLGSPVFSTSRLLVGQVAVFAQWQDERSLDDFLEDDGFGKVLKNGWHVRLSFLRSWGEFTDFAIPDRSCDLEDSSPVVAVTVAKMRLLEVPRFINWGRPEEKLVRDHPGAILSIASIRFPNTVSTFSIWKTEKEMSDMVQGHSAVPNPKRHYSAMREMERKDFHFEFATLRFRPIAEFGIWKGRGNFTSNS